jgi:hypothetical protein
MKTTTKTKLIIAFALLSAFSLQLPAFAQGTAFTYQGRLNVAGSPASGSYDLTFGLFDSLTGGTQQGTTITSTATPVTNGLFTVTLDFGNQFPGANRWLEIGARTNGGGAFATLSPRQQLTSTPYSVQAANANSVAAGNITGTLTTAQLPSSVVTNGAGGLNLSGTFQGNGLGLTNVPGTLPEHVVSSSSANAQPNQAYDANNSSQVTLTLPTSANVGDIVQANGLGAGGWQVRATGSQFINGFQAGANWTVPAGAPNQPYYSFASSADGTKLITGTYNSTIYTSGDGGATWVLQAGAPFGAWFSGQALACSSNGNNIVAVPRGGAIWTSGNGGVTWAPHPYTNSWQSVAASADGTKMVAVSVGQQNEPNPDIPGQIFTSADGGTTWSAHLYSNFWSSVASSADGTKLVATAGGQVFSFEVGGVGAIYTSSDSGTTWTLRPYTNSWQCVASSADGTKLFAAAYYGQIYTSTNSGTNWVAQGGVNNWQSIACSADGSKVVAAAGGNSPGQIYLSADGGNTWFAQPNSPNVRWECVRSSADGSRLVGGVDGGSDTGQIYTSAALPLAGGQGTSVMLQYAGNGSWQPVSLPGSAAAVPNSAVTRDGNGNFSAGNINAGNIAANGNITANSFSGNGSGPTFNGSATITGGSIYLDNSQALYAKNASGNYEVTMWPRYSDNVSYLNYGTGGFSIRNDESAVTMFMLDNNNVGFYGSVGIGTTSPANMLDVQGSADFISNVGIGTTSAGKLLQVGSPTSTTDGMIRLSCGNGSAQRSWDIGVPYGNTVSSSPYYGFVIKDATIGATRFAIDFNTGNVGIGKTNPAATLDVNGNIAMGNAQWFLARNTSGALENFLYPRWSDNVTYLNYGSNGFNIRNNSSITTMFMQNNGNVGIGTSTPGNQLQVNNPYLGAAGYGLMVAGPQYGANIQVNATAAAGGAALILDDYSDGGGNVDMLLIRNNNAAQTAFSVLANGNTTVGGGLSASGPLNVNNPGYPGITSIIRARPGDTGPLILEDSGGNNLFVTSVNGSVSASGDLHVGSGNQRLSVNTQYTSSTVSINGVAGDNNALYVNGTPTDTASIFWTQASDVRLKQDIRPFEPGLGELMQLRTVRYRYQDNPKRGLTPKDDHAGVLAQEVQKVFPDAVTTDQDGYLSLKADPIFWASINAIQELNQKLEKKDAEVADLKQQLADLKQVVNSLSEKVNGGAK